MAWALRVAPLIGAMPRRTCRSGRQGCARELPLPAITGHVFLRLVEGDDEHGVDRPLWRQHHEEGLGLGANGVNVQECVAEDIGSLAPDVHGQKRGFQRAARQFLDTGDLFRGQEEGLRLDTVRLRKDEPQGFVLGIQHHGLSRMEDAGQKP